MACYHPIPARTDKPGDQPQLWPPVGTANLELPCGTCLGCKSSRALDWAHRSQHEASQWEHNCFLTLTYSNERLPKNGQLQPADLQKFIKRLRRCRDRHHPGLASSSLRGIRYLAAGEYGDLTLRPHYHILLFNCGFTDLHQVANDLYESDLVNQLWTDGKHRLGTLTGASANYVAQYTVKKIGRTYATDDGEPLQQPFVRTSLKPAIGQDWINKYKNDLAQGYLVSDGHKTRVPRAYRQMLAKGSPTDQQLSDTIAARAAQATHATTNTDRTITALREAMERIHQAKIVHRSQLL